MNHSEYKIVTFLVLFVTRKYFSFDLQKAIRMEKVNCQRTLGVILVLCIPSGEDGHF